MNTILRSLNQQLASAAFGQCTKGIQNIKGLYRRPPLATQRFTAHRFKAPRFAVSKLALLPQRHLGAFQRAQHKHGLAVLNAFDLVEFLAQQPLIVARVFDHDAQQIVVSA